MKALHWKMSLVIGLVILFAFLLYPTFDWYSKTQPERDKLEAMKERPKHILNLGLDLRGGTHLLLELEVDKLDKSEKLNDAIQRAIEIVRNRVDAYGISETPIARVGDKWISVDLPGVSNAGQAEALIGKTAQLKFMLVDESTTASKILSEISALDKPAIDKDGNIVPEIKKILPPNLTILRGKSEESSSDVKYYVLESSVPLTGAYLENARVEMEGDFGMPHISFSFNKDGAKIFDTLTAKNVGRNLAIVLDDVVYTAPNIKSRIPEGKGIIEGSFTMEEARDIALVLRSGALPAPIKIIEKRVVGPSLGEDSIKKGIFSSMVGFIVVVLFMLFYYKGGGFVADIALSLNFLFLLGCLAYFNATLTLPGIAGMILSLAMAVDANVLILERMREEIEFKKPIPIIISTAYQKAWAAILDSNVTTWITSVFLFQFGSGPVKGFATTLIIGLVIGVFTSVFVTRVVYDFWLTSNPKHLSV
ncbi:MAG: protein translocase subunit SecD [Elusimicrobiales bacterium]|nr:protein translocase subunit SecD [Elusimicrobiales bacterium]